MGILLPHMNTRDCLGVCAIIILKPADMLYMYQHETVMRIKKKCGSAREKYFVKTLI